MQPTFTTQSGVKVVISFHFSKVTAINPTTTSFESVRSVSDLSFFRGLRGIFSICAAPPGISRPYTPLIPKGLAEVTTHLSRAQTKPVRTRLYGFKSFLIHVVVLFYGTPIEGRNKVKRIRGMILIGNYHHGIVNTRLHMVGTTGQEQIGITILPFQLEIDFLWVVVPQRCVGNVLTLWMA